MNFKEMCRTCLRSGEMMASLFDEEIEPAKHTAAELLAVFTSLQVNKEDDFPHNICDICLKEIQQAYSFDLKCKKSEIILHQLREIRVKLKKLKEIPKQNDIVSEVAGELESILKEDFKLEDVMNLCDRNIDVSESSAIGRIKHLEEENPNASDKLNRQILEEECTRDFQFIKSEPGHSNNFMEDDTNMKDVERNQIVSNFEIVEENYDDDYDQVTLKKKPDHNSPILKNNPGPNELNQNSPNFEIFGECAPEYQVLLKTEPDQNNLIIKDNESEDELQFSVTDFPVTFKSEPELDLGIDCSACLKQFQSLDMFRGHIVSDHLEENICKLCNEEFECSQFEHSAKHLPFSEPENSSGSSEESIKQTEKVQMTVIHNDEFFDKSDLQCKICSKVFKYRCRLVNHMRTHTGEKPVDSELCPKKPGTNHTDKLINDDKQVPDLQCSVCYKVFPVKWQLRRHMHVHNSEKLFQCKLCPAKFRQSGTLLYHRRAKHTDQLNSTDKSPDFQCSVCYKFFGAKHRLRNHMRVHTGEKPFQCKLCPEKFRVSSDLLCHRRSKHTDELISADKPLPDFQCSVCFKIFGRKWILRNHMRVHTGEKPFQCKLCPEKFKRSDALKSHEQTKHTDQKPFDCKFCPAKFKYSKTLVYHRQTKHTDKLINKDKPLPDFQCNVCDKAFYRKSLLKIHMRVHTGEKPFHCKLCPEKFRDSSALLYHRRTKHTDEFISDDKPIPDFQCSVCYKVFGLKCKLKNHMRVHTGENPFHCKLCPEKFRDSSALLYHRRTRHTDEFISDDKPIPDFQCSICSKIFGQKWILRNHMRVHTGEKPFHCKLCPAKFGHSNTLLYHIRTKHTDELISNNKTVADLQCSVCYKVFGLKAQLKIHMCTHTGEKPFHCALCPEKFVHNRALLCHRRTKHTDKFISENKPEAGL